MPPARWLLPLVLLVAGCSSNDANSDSGGPPVLCTPGQSVACVGPAGCAGGQACRADGTGYEPCSCAGGDAAVPADASPDGASTDAGSTDAAMADTGQDVPLESATDAAIDGGDATSDTLGSDDAIVDALTKPATPTIVSVVKLAGNLHVSWMNNDTGLTKIELWRNAALAYTYATATATNQLDAAATAPGTYCYKVITYRGVLASDASNEMCGTP